MCHWFSLQSQDASTSITGETQSLTIFPDCKSIIDHFPLTHHQLILYCELYIAHVPRFWFLKPLSLSVLSEQVPSDPDEPFFILSLTEIPVCSSGEVVDSVCEPFPYLPVTDTSIQQQRLVPAFYQLVIPMMQAVGLFGVWFCNFLHPSAVFWERVWQQLDMGLSLM